MAMVGLTSSYTPHGHNLRLFAAREAQYVTRGMISFSTTLSAPSPAAWAERDLIKRHCASPVRWTCHDPNKHPWSRNVSAILTEYL